MNPSGAVTRHLEAWRTTRAARFNNRSTQTVLAIAGPSGSGKSTLARSLAQKADVFCETTEGNPHLPLLLAGRLAQFDAAANQQWFLKKMQEFIDKASPSRPIILDQDPAAIVFVYSRLWLDDRLISGSAFAELVSSLIEVESELARWRAPRISLFLDAPAEILHRRAFARDAGSAPPLSWFQKARDYFFEL